MNTKNPFILALGILLVYVVLFLSFFLVGNYIMDLKGWGEIWGFAQFLVECLLVPVAIIGFIATITEIQKAQRIALLRVGFLYVNGRKKQLKNTAPISGVKDDGGVTPPLLLVNKGTAPSLYYQLTLEFPRGVSPQSIGNASHHWKSALQLRDGREVKVFIFEGRKEFIAFPQGSIDLGRIRFGELQKLPERIEVKYAVSGDTSQYLDGILILEKERKKIISEAIFAQPRVQRTRLRRARTVAVLGKGAFASKVVGQTRRAADAIVRRRLSNPDVLELCLVLKFRHGWRERRYPV